ncbi:MAG: peptidylprolyl isomerase [Bacteroidota bacterium]|nr:peptidylprolyl isomerase [Bacteroidota bacterium]
MRFTIVLMLLGFLFTQYTQAQSDPILFTIEGQSVPASEFKYIYSKNNRDDADFTEKSLREYLDLYTKFKVKVREAYAMRLDTVTQLKLELDGYRKQLAESYLTDKEITDKLIREAYDRMAKDIHVAHIMVRTNPNVVNDTMAGYEKIQKIYNDLKTGLNWDDATRRFSEDNSTKDMGGDMGYITSILPNGFYSFETAAYTTPAGTYSLPIRTSIGYHIVKVIDTRESRGEMDVAHILVRVKSDGSNEKEVKTKIESLYQQLLANLSFEEAARKNSEDKATSDRGGFIGVMNVNQFEKPFEDAAYALAKDGDISAPVRTRLGWHIVKRVKKRPLLAFDIMKKKIESQITRDERITAARQAMVNRIKKDAGYKVIDAVYNEFVSKAGEDLQTYRWQIPAVTPSAIVTLGQEEYTNIDFGNYVKNNARTRMGVAKGTSNKEILDKVFNEFVNEKALYYEEKNLVNKYPEFKSLMREYEEGIMLFEATKINVWDKASRDSIGLKQFHATHRNDYMWEERVEISTLTLDSANMSKLPLIKKWAVKKPLSVVAAKATKKKIPVMITKRIYQKDETLPAGLTWTSGSKADLPDGKGIVSIERVIPPQPKSLEEARGYIIADYQDQLEKEWVASLQKKYPVKVDESVFKTLVRK